MFLVVIMFFWGVMYKMSNIVVPPGKKQLVGHSGNIYSDTDDSDDELNEKPFQYVTPFLISNAH